MNAIHRRGAVRALLVLAAATLAAGCAVRPLEQAQASRDRPSREPVFNERVLQDYAALVRIMTGDDVDCGSQNPCPVNVPVSFTVNSAGDEFCLAKFPAKIYWARGVPPGPARRVEWTLVPDTGVTRTFSFDADLGIMPIKNQGELGSMPNSHGAFNGNKSYYYVHKNGPPVGPTKPVQYLSIVWLNAPGSAAPPPTKAATCGTIDPIMINDGS